jgi:hypothetical protein
MVIMRELDQQRYRVLAMLRAVSQLFGKIVAGWTAPCEGMPRDGKCRRLVLSN